MLVTTLLLSASSVVAFHCPLSNTLLRHRRGSSQLFTSPSLDTKRQPSHLPGVEAMEHWLRSDPTATWNEHVRHARFDDDLRGLEWTGPRIEKPIQVVSLPASKTIQADYSDSDWDAHLAIKLSEEVLKGKESPFYAYIQHLTEGQSTLVPAAPNAIRHWNDEQRERLMEHPAGVHLLALDEKQQQDWQRKYNSLAKSGVTPSLFFWAMEVVHSRAFRGQTVKSNALASLLAPVLAAAAGMLYMSSTPEPSLLVLGTMAALAVAPVVWTANAPAASTVSLLPMIDSANHYESADSQITFDPLSNSYQLVIGPRCIDKATNQLFISYGARSEEELLLNYGFLPDFSLGAGDPDSCRKALAEGFKRRKNPPL